MKKLDETNAPYCWRYAIGPNGIYESKCFDRTGYWSYRTPNGKNRVVYDADMLFGFVNSKYTLYSEKRMPLYEAQKMIVEACKKRVAYIDYRLQIAKERLANAMKEPDYGEEESDG